MVKYKALALTTNYWKPGENYLKEIEDVINGKIEDGDFIVISEKAISTALNNIIDESKITPSMNAKLIARCWMRIAWGYFLGPLCGFGGKLLSNLRAYPPEAGSRHKQLSLQHAGPLQALLFGSEGGIDGSNLAYSYVSLPLKNPDETAKEIHKHLLAKLQKNICVMISDTDKTYSLRNYHFTPRPKSVEGIYSRGAIFAYVAGRTLKLKKRATPLAVAGCTLAADRALEIAEIANRARGFGAGLTVWDMAERFNVDLDGVSWEMLATVRHKPIVIVRRRS
jgi:F420-0:gamma-glutamyl ligase-like protein